MVIYVQKGRHPLYSDLRATTGSFLEAIPDGMRPAMKVRKTLIRISIIAPPSGRTALRAAILVRWIRIAFIGISRIRLVTIPMTPAQSPTITVSALKILEMSFLEAPIARSIPISLVRSSTEMYVITPIMMEDTISEIATKAMST